MVLLYIKVCIAIKTYKQYFQHIHSQLCAKKTLETISRIKNYNTMVTTVQTVQTLIVSLLQVLGCGWFSVKSPTLKFSSSHIADHSGHVLNER